MLVELCLPHHSLCDILFILLFVSQELQANIDQQAVRGAISELEALVAQLVGAGIKDMGAKDWRRRLRNTESVLELCSGLLEFERELSQVGEGLPVGGDDEALAPQVREADIYEAEFVLPVAELHEEQVQL